MHALHRIIIVNKSPVAIVGRSLVMFGTLLLVIFTAYAQAQTNLPLSKRGGIDIDGNNKSVLLVRGTGHSGAAVLSGGRLVNGQFQFTP